MSSKKNRRNKGKQKQIRTDFRKNRAEKTRRVDLTREFDWETMDVADELIEEDERVSGKGELTRRRTVVGKPLEDDATGLPVELEVDESKCLRGRVLSVHGLTCEVEDETGEIYNCAVRRLLKTLATDQRNIVATGDLVLFRPAEGTNRKEGIIEKIEPRKSVLCRKSQGKQHVIVANVDQLLVIVSAAEPPLKPNLIDRLLVSAEKADIRPVICINKIDLVDPAQLVPLQGQYAQMGYEVVLLSAVSGFGIERLRRLLAGHQSVLAGQSGVGKSSLLNAVDPRFNLRVAPVSADSGKGRHTTTAARLLPLQSGGYVVDTPGIRQFELWDVIPEEIAGYMRDIRPYVSGCRYPDCTHTHEVDCAVKEAVRLRRIDIRRYESYCHMLDDQSLR